jgi:hypothetical protein
MSRQRDRHQSRMPREAMVELALSKVLPAGFSLRVEVVDHDAIHDLLVYVEVPGSALAHQLAALPADVRSSLALLAQQNPDDRCLANWSATFECAGERLGGVGVLDRVNRRR